MEGAFDDLTQYEVACPYCGEKFVRITSKHLQLHGKSMNEYRASYGYTTLLQRSSKKIMSLYKPSITKWCTTYEKDGERRYVTKQYYEDAKDPNSKSATKYWFKPHMLNQHFLGNNLIAVFPRYEDESTFFAFDIDSRDLALEHTRKIVETLRSERIRFRNIHVSYSGGKGYHVELFVNRPIKIERWVALGQYVLAQAGLSGIKTIEFRPTKTNSHALKLPLTRHNKTGNFAAYLNPVTFELLGVSESHEYLFALTPMYLMDISDVLSKAKQYAEELKRKEDEDRAERAKAREERRKQTTEKAIKVKDDRVFPTTDDKRQSVKRAMREGLVAQGTRWNTMQAIALYLYHDQGQDVDAIRQFLAEWTAVQISHGKVETPYQRCLDEIDNLLEWVPSTEGFFAKKRDLTISSSEVAWVLSVPQRCARDILWALLLRSKAYSGDTGTFFTSDRALQKMFHPIPVSRPTIIKWRRWLIENGFVEADVPPPKKEGGKATTYRLLMDVPKSNQIVGEVDFSNDMDCRQLLRTVAAKMYDEKQLKKMKLATPPTTQNVKEAFLICEK